MRVCCIFRRRGLNAWQCLCSICTKKTPAGDEILWYCTIAKVPSTFSSRKKNVVSLWDPVLLKHIASFVKRRHARKKPATRVSRTRTVNSCNPDAVTGKMSNAARDTGVYFQGEATVNFGAWDTPAQWKSCVNAGAWKVWSASSHRRHGWKQTSKPKSSFYGTSYSCIEVD